jgi:hypothetical protein
VATDNGTLFAEIGALIEAPSVGPTAPTLDRLESTLTTGYARALSLEAEQHRLEKRIGEIVGGLTVANRETTADELTTLGQQLARATADLARLRTLLVTLRTRAASVRLAATA